MNQEEARNLSAKNQLLKQESSPKSSLEKNEDSCLIDESVIARLLMSSPIADKDQKNDKSNQSISQTTM